MVQIKSPETSVNPQLLASFSVGATSPNAPDYLGPATDLVQRRRSRRKHSGFKLCVKRSYLTGWGVASPGTQSVPSEPPR